MAKRIRACLAMRCVTNFTPQWRRIRDDCQHPTSFDEQHASGLGNNATCKLRFRAQSRLRRVDTSYQHRARVRRSLLGESTHCLTLTTGKLCDQRGISYLLSKLISSKSIRYLEDVITLVCFAATSLGGEICFRRTWLRSNSIATSLSRKPSCTSQ